MVARTQCSLGCMSLFLWPLTSGFGSGEDDVDSVVAGPVDLSWERARTTGVDAVASGDAVGQRVQRQTVDAGGREAVLVDQVVTGVGVIAGDIGVPAVTATGEGRLTYCQPDSVSPEKVALASWCRCCSIRCPVSTGVMTALEQADAGVEAVWLARKRTPSSTVESSTALLTVGVADAGQIVQAQGACARWRAMANSSNASPSAPTSKSEVGPPPAVREWP